MVHRRGRGSTGLMLSNSSLDRPSYFTLGAFSKVGHWRWLYFLLILCVYAVIVVSNLLLLLVIILKRGLHQPMFLLLCSLFLNEFLGSSALFPFLLFQTLQEQHHMPYSLCFLQVFLVHSYGAVEFSNLVVMAYDRYLAICYPLQYQQLMSPQRLALITAALWLWAVLSVVIAMSLTLRLRLCGHVIPKVYCDNFSLVRLACGDTTANNAYGLTYIFTVLLGLISLILYSYGQILRVCLNIDSRTRHKALHTCTPHLLLLLSFSFGSIFEMVQSRFNINAPVILKVLLSLYFLTIQPLLSPLLYGLQMRKLRDACRDLCRRMMQRTA